MSKETDDFIKSFQEMAEAYKENPKYKSEIEELKEKVDFLEGGLELLACYIFATHIKDKSKKGPVELLVNDTDALKWIKEISRQVLPTTKEEKEYFGGHTEKIAKLDPYHMKIHNHGWTDTRMFIMKLENQACLTFKKYRDMSEDAEEVEE